jgi:pimeloyl-ACP methyl ester carboxylesterase
LPHKYFQIDGVATYVHHTGATTLPGRPPAIAQGEAVVCLHGAGGNGQLFAGLMTGLEASHSVIAFDQPGHGRSGSLDSLADIGRMADFTGKLLDALELDSAVLVGHDMGAAVAIRCALDRPASVRALVLCSAGDRFDVSVETLELARRVRDGKERRPFDASVFSKKTSPDVMKQAFMEGMKTDPRATYGDLVACSQWADADRLGEIGAATTVIHGDDDHEWLKTRAAALATAIPGAVLDTIPDAGHSLLLEAPVPLAQKIGACLGGLSS